MHRLMQDPPRAMPHLFNRAETLFPKKEIVTATGAGKERISYGDWAARTRKLGGVLDTLGVSADGRVGTFGWNTARHLELWYGVPCTNRVLHTLNIRLFPDQLTYIVNHAEDEVIFVDRSLLGLLWPLVSEFETVKHYIVIDDCDAEVPDDPRILHYEEVLGAGEPVEFNVEDENLAAAMCYTSGTTGNPKGVVYSHRSTVLHCMAAAMVDTLAVAERDTILPVVPMFHANAWGLCQAGVMAGANIVFPGRDLSPQAIADLMEKEHITLAAGVPTIWMGVLPLLEGRDLSHLKRIVCGGSAVPKALSEGYREKIGMPILQAWGMTETSPIASVCTIKTTVAGRSEGELADIRA